MNSLGLGVVTPNVTDEENAMLLTLYLHCQEYGLATKVFEELKDLDIGLVRFQAVWHARVFQFALLCIHNAMDIQRLFKRRYWMRLALKYVSMIEVWVKQYKAINM
jgi:hypothetical protein